MADAESIKKEIDTINTNDQIEVQEMEEFLKSDDNIKKLGEFMESGASTELLEEMEVTLKDLCEDIVLQEDISENQENIMNYFINKFGNKYPELKEKIELDNTTNTCIKENQIKVENIESINKWCNILGERKVNTKEKVANIIQNKVDDISKSVNKKIGQNKTGFGFLYGESEIKFIQLWANVKFGENLTINGKRGGRRSKDHISSLTNEGITNLYIYRHELITRQGVIDYRKTKPKLTNYENLLNIPNLDAKLRLLTPDQQNSVMERFLAFFLSIKQPGMSFENKIGNENLQTILTDLISAKIYENLSVEDYFKIFYEEELMDEDTKSLKTDLMSSYKTMGEYFQTKATQNMEIVKNEKGNLVNADTTARYSKFTETFNKMNAEEDPAKKEQLKNQLKEQGNDLLSKSGLSNDQRRSILIMLGGAFSEIQTQWDKKTIVNDRLDQGTLYRGKPGNSTPISIEYTPGCNVRVEIDEIVTRTINENGKDFTFTDPRKVKIFLDDKELSPQNIKREGYDIHIDENNCLIIRKLGGEGSELRESLGDEIYNQYQTAQNETNLKAQQYEAYNEVLVQVQSGERLKLSGLSEYQLDIINNETGYTKTYNDYLNNLEIYNTQRSVQPGGGSFGWMSSSPKPIEPQKPAYGEYCNLLIPGCEGKLVHIKPSELDKISSIIYSNHPICFIPSHPEFGNIYELIPLDLKFYEKDNKGNTHIFQINDDLSKGKEINTITAEDTQEAQAINSLIMSTINASPGLQQAWEKAINIGDDFQYIENLYKKFDRSNGSDGLSDDDAKNMRLKAYDLAISLDELCKHHNEFVQLKNGLEKRHSGNSNVNTETEQLIKSYINNLDYLIKASVKGGSMYEYCQFMLNPKEVHSNDEWLERFGRRFKDNLLRTICAIAGGVAAVSLAPATGGSSLRVLAKMAMIMTAGGMFGGFIGQVTNEAFWSRYYAGGTTIKYTENGVEKEKKIDLRYGDPTSLELAIQGKLSRGDYASQTALQFLIGSVTTFGCMYAGQLIGRSITEACESGTLSPKFSKFLTKFNKNFKVDNGDPITDGIFKDLADKVGQNSTSLIKDFNKQFFKEFRDEISEEISETGFDEAANAFKGKRGNTGLARILSGAATLATAWHCITPGGNMSKLYRENGISIGNLDYNNGRNTFEITLDYNGDRQAIIEYYTKDGYKEVNGHLQMKNPNNPSITNIIHLQETSVPIGVRRLASQLSGYGITIDRETGKGEYEDMEKIQALELSGAANVQIDPKTKKVTIISGDTTLELEQQYFGGKSHKFDVTEKQARTNSKMMDKLGKANTETQITEEEIKTKKQTLQEQYKQITGREIQLTDQQVASIPGLKEQIQNQYKKATGREIQLADIQIISIIEAHGMAGEIGNLDPTEISAKNHVLGETIGDGDVRRFLFEAGFCAKSEPNLRDPLNIIQRRQIESRIRGDENDTQGSSKENPDISNARDELAKLISETEDDYKKIALTDMMERVEDARNALDALIKGELTITLKDGTIKQITTIEEFMELYYIFMNESKSKSENGDEIKWKKIDEESRCIVMRYFYEAIMKPLGLKIIADPRLTMTDVNEQFVDETHSDGFEINKSDKFTVETGEITKIGDSILDLIAIAEGRKNISDQTAEDQLRAYHGIGYIGLTIEEKIGELGDTTEGKIARELRLSIQKHSEGKISIEDQAYLFAFSMKQMARYIKAHPDNSPELVFTMLNSNQNKLLHQHLWDLNTVTSSDHGIKHILRGNATLADNMFSQLDSKDEDGQTMRDKLYNAKDDEGNPKNRKEGEDINQFKARWETLVIQGIIDHDLGYTHIGNKAFDEAGFDQSFKLVADHPLRSTTWIENNKTFYTVLFGEDGYNSLVESVPGHSNAQTQNIPKIAKGEASQTEFVRGILSCVDCAGSPGDYKIAHMFAQNEMIGGLFNAFSLFEAGDIEGAKQALRNLVDVIDGMDNSGELALIKESWKKAIDAFLTNKHYEEMDGESMGKALGFSFNKFLGAFGVVTEIDPDTGKVKANINKNKGFSIEFALAGESFEILADRFGAGVALKSLIGVCDDYKINDKGPTSKFLVRQTDQAIKQWKAEKANGWENNNGQAMSLKEFMVEFFNHPPTQEEVTQCNQDLKEKAREDARKEAKKKAEKNGESRDESTRVRADEGKWRDITFDGGIFYSDGKADSSSIDFSPKRGIVIKGPNNVEVTLNFDGKSYEGFNETAGRFLEMNQKIKKYTDKIEKNKNDPLELRRIASDAAAELGKYGELMSDGKKWIDTKEWAPITKEITDMANLKDSEIDAQTLRDKINSLASAYKIQMKQVQSSNPTLNN